VCTADAFSAPTHPGVNAKVWAGEIQIGLGRRTNSFQPAPLGRGTR
jgi:hypothetical protein